MRIAAAQIRCQPGNLAANMRRIRQMAERAKADGVQWVLLPEMSDLGYVMEVIKSQACSWEEGAVPELRSIAQQLGLGIICGVSERDGDAIFNSQVVIDSRGSIISRYRKTHLFAVKPVEEEKFIAPGVTLSCAFLGDVRAGLSICYDLRFPELYRALISAYLPDVFLLSSAWPAARVEHLRILATARAIENQSYFVVANRVGTDERAKFGGSSMIIDPSGVIIACAANDEEQLLQGDISPERIAEVRGRMPVLEHKRTDLVLTGELHETKPMCQLS